MAALCLALALLVLPSVSAVDNWYNSSWHFRQKVELNASGYVRQNYPVELSMNFTELLRQGGSANRSFDANSIRVFEYSPAGSLLYEVTSQFDQYNTYDANTNAVGEIVFIANGTTRPYEKRRYFIYFDTIFNGIKPATSYSTAALNYSSANGEFNVNNSLFQWYIDLSREENTSGIYRVAGTSNEIFTAASNEKTYEYSEYTNETSNFTFNFSGVSFVSGPVRLTAIMSGNESLWNNPSAITSQAILTKKYKFYADGAWIKIDSNYTSISSGTISRGSTPSGAVAFEAERAFGSTYIPQNNLTEPYSWAHASDQFNSFGVGFINILQSGTSNFLAAGAISNGRIGINLSTTQLSSGASILDSALMKFNDTTGDLNTLKNLSLGFYDGFTPVVSTAEAWKVNATISTTFSIYNRNETVIVRLNITSDAYNFTNSANLTVDNGTAGAADDFNLTLFDDGAHNDLNAGDGVFGNNFTLTQNDSVSSWNLSGRVYGQGGIYLSSNFSLINVTSEYNMTISVMNPFGIAGRQINITGNIWNFRQDASIVGFSLSCGYALDFAQDFGNGTYRAGFTSPSSHGNFSAQCNATKAGNAGINSTNFTSESAFTNATIANGPLVQTISNITLVQNQNFSIQVNISNYGNGTAYLSNITLQLPGNWTAGNLSYNCANVTASGICSANFNITVANRTVPGNYTVNAAYNWQNPDGSAGINSTNSTVIVASNPILEVTENSIYNIVSQGLQKRIGNFTIQSIGNDAIANLTFNVTGLGGIAFTFAPSTIASLSAGFAYSVQANVTVSSNHSSGDYQGIINIYSANGGGDSLAVNLTVSGANVSINTTPLNHTASNITIFQNENFTIGTFIRNDRNATAFLANITIIAPAGISINSSGNICGNMSVGSNCSAGALVTVLNGTIPGNYLVNVSAFWIDIEDGIKANLTVVNITVLSNPQLNILESNVTGNATHGNTSVVGIFTLRSIGNAPLLNTTIGIIGLQNFTINLTATNVSNLTQGQNQVISINATIPENFEPGEYNGTINLTSANGGNATIVLTIRVSVDRDWDLTPTSCERTESPDVATLCEVTIFNYGNTFINFSVSPSLQNFTSPQNTSFSIEKNSSATLNITYNITGQPKIIYNATFNVTANSSGSSPAFRLVRTALVPYNSLTASLKISPLVVQNNQTVIIDFNFTDSNLVGVKNVTASVTMPNGTNRNFSMVLNSTLFNATGNVTQWQLRYNTTQLVGNYTVLVLAYDNVDVNGSATGTFYAYPKLSLTTQTSSTSYAKGSTASIIFRARDLGGTALANVNATIWVKSNNSILAFNQTYTTTVSGFVEPLPTFSIPEDAVAGNWNIYSEARYFDPNASITITDAANSTFQVVNTTTANVSFSGLLTNMQVSDLFFGGDAVQIAISVYDVNGAASDPDSMNITILYPNESVYSVVDFSSLNRSSTGIYFHKFTAPANAPSGVYRAELNASKGAYSTRNIALFRISGSLRIEVETSFVWYPSSVMTFRMLAFTGDGLPIDPTTMNLTVIDPAGNTYFSTQLASMTKQSTGYYVYNFAMGANTSTGNYYAQLFATKDSTTTVALKPFRVSQGGPYDYRFELLENEVRQGDYLDFRVVAENKGEVTQDVTLEYWVSDGSQTWYYGSEALLTPAFQNTSVLRSAYIFTSQPAKTYTLYGRLTYDLIKPPIDISYTFAVLTSIASTPTPSVGGPGVVITPPPGGAGGSGVAASPQPTSTTAPPVRDYSGMQIVSYPDEVTAQAGEIKYPKIQVKNTGLILLHNVTVTLSGIPLSWLEVLPSKVNALSPGDTATFVLKITVPATERTAIRNVRAIAFSEERKEEVRFDVSIFESKLSLIEYMIRRLKESIEALTKDTKEAEKVGKSVGGVWEALEQAQKYTQKAEDELRNEQLDDAYGDAQIADTLLAKAKGLLISAPFAPPVNLQVPNWITLAMGILGTSMGILLFWFVRKRKKKAPAPTTQSAGVIETVRAAVQRDDSASLIKEKGKISRALRLLEDELHDGSISQGAYSELHGRYQRKLADLERKMQHG
ncbi:hypothetical protein HY989_05685 [Candidatus Micrarchaeota archaeon]|nr:hypothetical protein [Candidatus Micrarchaeota archaeon]